MRPLVEVGVRRPRSPATQPHIERLANEPREPVVGLEVQRGVGRDASTRTVSAPPRVVGDESEQRRGMGGWSCAADALEARLDMVRGARLVPLPPVLPLLGVPSRLVVPWLVVWWLVAWRLIAWRLVVRGLVSGLNA